MAPLRPILDIFSKKKERPPKKEEKIKIIADHREKNSSVISELVHLGIEIEFQQLKVADYIVKGVAIERKTISDFISSMINKRLMKQLEELRQYEDRLLLIEGIDEQELYSDDFSEQEIGMHPNAVRGFLLSILLRYKVPIIFTKDGCDTAMFFSVLARRKSKEISLNVTKKNLTPQERMRFILESFPGIGPKTSRKLLEKLGSIRNIANASEEELKEILGKKAEVVKKLFEEDYTSTKDQD